MVIDISSNNISLSEAFTEFELSINNAFHEFNMNILMDKYTYLQENGTELNGEKSKKSVTEWFKTLIEKIIDTIKKAVNRIKDALAAKKKEIKDSKALKKIEQSEQKLSSKYTNLKRKALTLLSKPVSEEEAYKKAKEISNEGKDMLGEFCDENNMKRSDIDKIFGSRSKDIERYLSK